MQRIRRICSDLFWNADTTTVRLILAVSSLLWAITLFSPEASFARKPFYLMASLASENVWGVLFLLHFLGSLWRFIDPVPRIRWALTINIYGLVLWLFTTISINLSINSFTPGNSLEWVICVFGFWNLYRTGLRAEIVTP